MCVVTFETQGHLRKCSIFMRVPLRPIVHGVVDPALDAFSDAQVVMRMQFIQAQLKAPLTYLEVLATYGDVVRLISEQTGFAAKGLFITKSVGATYTADVMKFATALMVRAQAEKECARTIACKLCKEMVYCEDCAHDDKVIAHHIMRCVCVFCKVRGYNRLHCTACGYGRCGTMACVVLHHTLHESLHGDTGADDEIRLAVEGAVDLSVVRLDRAAATMVLHSTPAFRVVLDVGSVKRDDGMQLCTMAFHVPVRELVDTPPDPRFGTLVGDEMLGIMADIQAQLCSPTPWPQILATYPDIANNIIAQPDFRGKGFSISDCCTRDVMRFAALVMHRYTDHEKVIKDGVAEIFAELRVQHSAAVAAEHHAEDPRVCAVCGQESRKSCGRCRQERYCSRECQEEAWPSHRLDCLE